MDAGAATLGRHGVNMLSNPAVAFTLPEYHGFCDTTREIVGIFPIFLPTQDCIRTQVPIYIYKCSWYNGIKRNNPRWSRTPAGGGKGGMRMRGQVKKVEQVLKKHGIPFTSSGDEFTFAISPTAEIHTPNCTIELYQNEITVNEQPTTLDDFIYDVLAVEK
jgi:hypothetical protein